MATIIKITGEKEYIEPASGKVFTLEELQKAVNGLIEIVYLSGKYVGKLMLVDEEGLLKQNPQINNEASIIAKQGRTSGTA